MDKRSIKSSHLSTSTFNVLLIEDSKADIDLICEAWQESVFKISVNSVRDGDQALKYLRQQKPFENALRPDLLILDLNLPRKDGWTTLEEIKSDKQLKAIPVIVFTTSESEEDVRRCYSLGANCYISKPFQYNELKEVFQTVEKFWFSVAKLPAGSR